VKVILLARSLETGGMQRQLVELAKRLAAEDHEVEVVLFYGGNSVLEGELTVSAVPLTVLGKAQRWDVARFVLRLLRHVRAARPDVVYSFLTVPNVLGALLRPFWRPARVVWGVRDSNVDMSRYTRALKASLIASRVVARCADAIIYNSRAGRDHYVAAGYPAERGAVVPNGIDVDRFVRDEAARVRVRAVWGVGAAEQVIGVVARLDPMKGHPTLFEAARLVRERVTGVRFVCVGPGPEEYRLRLMALVERAGLGDSVVWAGELEDIVAAYSGMDALCLPSWSGEGFPNVLAEGMACGLVAVATEVGDAALIVDDRELLVPPRDAAALADAIERALGKLAVDRGQAATRSRGRIVDHFSATQLASRTLEVLETTRIAGARETRSASVRPCLRRSRSIVEVLRTKGTRSGGVG
jgi:glycosyltransferase involved in cell wall biosynthesis